MPVFLSPEDERRTGNLAVDLGQLRQGALVTGAHLDDEGADGGVLEALPQVSPEILGQARAPGEEGALGAREDEPGEPPEDGPVQPVLAQDADLPRGVGVAEDQRVHHHQALDAVGVGRREGQRRLAAHVGAEEGDAIDAPSVEQRAEAGGEVLRRGAAGPGVAPAHARPVHGDRLEARREEGEELGEDLEVLRVAVEAEERGPAAEARDAQALAALHGLERGLQHQALRSWRRRSAARIPEMAVKLTHCPGCVELPAR